MSGTLPWYVARASGLVAWSLLAGSVVWGLLMTSKVLRGRVKGSWLLDLHRWLGGLAVVFTGVHVVAIMADTYVHFGLGSVLVPFVAHWHPVAVAWGIASLYLLAAVEATSLLRRRIPNVVWRRVHYASLPLFVSATLHGLSAGTDGRTPMVLITAGLVCLAVCVLIAVRADSAWTGQVAKGHDQPGVPAQGAQRPSARGPETPSAQGPQTDRQWASQAVPGAGEDRRSLVV